MNALALATPNAIASPSQTNSRASFVPLSDAARILRITEGHLRRLCSDQYRASGLARKVGGQWEINRRLHPALSGIETAELRDWRQIAELREQGYTDAAIARAEAVRDIVTGYSDFGGNAKNEDGRQREYVNRLAASGMLRKAGLKRYSPRSLRRHVACYFQHGDAGGIKTLARRPSNRRGQREIGESSFDMFLTVKHMTRGVTVASAYDQVAGYIIEAGLGDDPAWAWPALRTVQQHYQATVPEPFKIMANDGPRVFRARCAPKIKRDYSNLAAGETICGDERIFDFMARAIGDRGWRRVRLKLTAWICVRSRRFVGCHISESANSDTILSAFKQAVLTMETVPQSAIIDNGRDYKAVGGGPRKNRKWDAWDDSRMTTAFERLAVDVTYAIPHSPWSKSIESQFNAVKREFDRYFASFWGGRPDERPWDADRWTRENIHRLPTIEEVREAFKAFLAAHHEVPRRGDGMDGLTPNQAFKAFYTATPRRATSATLDVICTKRVGPVKVTRDGVRYQRTQYGTRNETLMRMQGREVWLAVDPIEFDRVTVCEEDGRPITIAEADQLRGVTQEEVRESMAFGRRMEKVARTYVESRDYSLKTLPQQIASRRAAAARARQVAERDLPEPKPIESVEIVRPDIAAAADRVRKASGAEALRRLAASDAKAEAVNELARIDLWSLESPDVNGGDDSPRRLSLWDIPVDSEGVSNAAE